MMTMEATLVKCRLRPARRALSESREHTQGQTGSCEVEGLQRCLRLATCCFALSAERTRQQPPPQALQSPCLPLGESWADGTALALGTAAHTTELHTELAGRPGKLHVRCIVLWTDTLFSQTAACILCCL